MNFKVIVHVWLDVENTILGVSRQPFMRKIRTRDWSRDRMKIFIEYTLKSLINQTFQDFEIFLFLGRRFREIHDEFDLPDKVRRIYDDGKGRYSRRIKNDYVVVIRTDSDDLFREDMMEAVVNGAKFDPDRRTCRVWKDVIQWNIHHKFISDFKLPRSPFTAHVFPRKIYSDWDRMKKEQFMDYASCRHLQKERMVCIVRHGNNVTFPRIGKNMYSRRYYESEMIKRNQIVRNPSEMKRILRRFGIPKEMVR